jgi:hypothetical protein
MQLCAQPASVRSCVHILLPTQLCAHPASVRSYVHILPPYSAVCTSCLHMQLCAHPASVRTSVHILPPYAAVCTSWIRMQLCAHPASECSCVHILLPYAVVCTSCFRMQLCAHPASFSSSDLAFSGAVGNTHSKVTALGVPCAKRGRQKLEGFLPLLYVMKVLNYCASFYCLRIYFDFTSNKL